MRLALRPLPVLVGAVLAVLVSGFLHQLVHPFLEHDDWDFLLPVEQPRTTQMHDRLLAEGRWFNYVWWRVIGNLFSPTAAVVVFMLAVLVIAGVVGWRWAPGWLAAPVVLALTLSPMTVDLSFWPATLLPSMVLVAIAAAVLPWCVDDPRRLTAWTVLSTVLVFLAYPPTTLVLLVLVAAELIDRPLRELVVGVVTYGASYVAGTVVVFTLNAISFGHFGIVARPWRNPNPVHGPGDLFENIGRALDQLGGLFTSSRMPLILGLLALATCIALPALRERGLKMAALVVIGLGVQSSATVLTGVTTPYRSMGWIWFVVVLLLIWLFEEVRPRRSVETSERRPVERWIPLAALLALLAVGGWGARYWQNAIDHDQRRRVVLQRVLDQLEETVAANPGLRVVVVGTPSDWANPAFTQQAQYLSMKAFQDAGIRSSNCRPPVCAVSTRAGVLARADHGARAFVSFRFVVFVPPAHKDALAH
ncbi:MAG: hypothetical protein ACJ72E_03190 [Marmoricola sp.]